jgi:hypothetical protein
MSEKYVFVATTATSSQIITIVEPGSQSSVRFIQCSPQEALEIMKQLEEVLSQ